jgi:regulator of ribonuclease activity A
MTSNAPPLSSSLSASLFDISSSCQLCDDFPEQIRIPNNTSLWKSYGGRFKFSGVVATVHAASMEDPRLKNAVLESGNGRILLIVRSCSSCHSASIGNEGPDLDSACCCSERAAILGEENALAAAVNGWSGIIVQGYVRNITTLSKLPLGILALGHTPRAVSRTGTSETISLTSTNSPVSVGNVVCHTGDFACADEDGLVFLDQKVVEASHHFALRQAQGAMQTMNTKTGSSGASSPPSTTQRSASDSRIQEIERETGIGFHEYYRSASATVVAVKPIGASRSHQTPTYSRSSAPKNPWDW